MTVNSFYYQKPVNTISLPRINNAVNFKKVKRFGKTYINGNIVHDKKAFINTVALFCIIACSILITTFICFQSVNADLDYRITESKDQLKLLEIENAELQTNLVQNISNDYVVKWADQNGFVKNNNFSHFEMTQPKVLSLNSHN